MSSGCTSCCRRTAMRRCARPSSAASPSRRSAPSTSRTISAPPMPPLPFDDAGPAADDKRPSAAARRPGPGRRRRPQGRSAAEHLDAAEHGGILSPRRRPVMIAADHRSRRALQAAAPRQCAARLARPRAARRAGALVLSRLPHAAGHRGDRASPADAPRATHAARALSVSEDDRRFQFHLSIVAAPPRCSARRSRPTSSPRAAR